MVFTPHYIKMFLKNELNSLLKSLYVNGRSTCLLEPPRWLSADWRKQHKQMFVSPYAPWVTWSWYFPHHMADLHGCPPLAASDTTLTSSNLFTEQTKSKEFSWFADLIYTLKLTLWNNTVKLWRNPKSRVKMK